MNFTTLHRYVRSNFSSLSKICLQHCFALFFFNVRSQYYIVQVFTAVKKNPCSTFLFYCSTVSTFHTCFSELKFPTPISDRPRESWVICQPRFSSSFSCPHHSHYYFYSYCYFHYYYHHVYTFFAIIRFFVPSSLRPVIFFFFLDYLFFVSRGPTLALETSVSSRRYIYIYQQYTAQQNTRATWTRDDDEKYHYNLRLTDCYLNTYKYVYILSGGTKCQAMQLFEPQLNGFPTVPTMLLKFPKLFATNGSWLIAILSQYPKRSHFIA